MKEEFEIYSFFVVILFKWELVLGKFIEEFLLVMFELRMSFFCFFFGLWKDIKLFKFVVVEFKLDFLVVVEV